MQSFLPSWLAAPALAAVLALALAPFAAADESTPLRPEQVRWSEVRKDALSEAIDPQDLQIVVLLPLNACGSPSGGNVGIVMAWHCLGLMQLEAAPEMAGLDLVLMPDVGVGTSVSQSLQQLEAQGLPATHRYALIMDWAVSLREAGGHYYHMALATESVLFDRREQRWRWQAVQRYERYTGERLTPEAVLSDLALHLRRVVLPPVLDRPKTLAPSERYAMSWVTPEQALQAPAADRARVVLFNDYAKTGRSSEYVADDFQLMAEADIVDAKSRYQPPAVQLPLGTRSYIAFDLRPGDYALFTGVDGRKPLKLKGGQVQFVRYARGMFNRDVLDEPSAGDAAALQARSKHAVLEDRSEPPRAHSPVRFVKD